MLSRIEHASVEYCFSNRAAPLNYALPNHTSSPNFALPNWASPPNVTPTNSASRAGLRTGLRLMSELVAPADVGARRFSRCVTAVQRGASGSPR